MSTQGKATRDDACTTNGYTSDWVSGNEVNACPYTTASAGDVKDWLREWKDAPCSFQMRLDDRQVGGTAGSILPKWEPLVVFEELLCKGFVP